MLRKTSLDSGWRFACKRWLPLPRRIGFSSLEWLPATVPGHVHDDLYQAAVIADPLALQHELGCQWVDEEEWCYEKEFDFQPDPAAPRRVLSFEGLDTVCRLFLNDVAIAEHDNMFLPLSIDVTERLQVGRNVLRVEFASAAAVGRERRQRYLASEGIPFDVERFDERAFVRKAQYMYGWDWGPRLVSAGIWQPVRLLEFSGRIVDVDVSQRHLPDGAVELSVQTSVEGQGTAIHTLEFDGVRRKFRDGQVIRLEKPELWWPHGMGEAKLYPLTTELSSQADATALAASSGVGVLDSRETRIGLRTIALVQEVDAFGKSFSFVVNGRPMWAFGSNWIPDHSFPSKVDRARVRDRLSKARDMGTNMLRIWGGGLYEGEDFYDACDEFGILVWQDFPFACNYAPDDEAAQEVMRREASAAVRRLRHRASLALWCGNNENRTMFESKWGNKEKHPARYQGERIWHETLPAVLAELDPGRPYVASSPHGGSLANADEEGDQHNWDVWHGRGDWVHYAESRGRFISEFGFAAAPGPRAWRAALAPRYTEAQLEPRDRIARWHDKTAKGYETFLRYVELHYPAAKTLSEWSYYSQLNQRDALRFAIEHYRAGEFCRGTLIWQLNDCWPVQSWAVLDSEGDYKAAAFELRRLFSPLLCCVFADERHVRVVAALDNVADPRSVEFRLELRQLSDGGLVRSLEARAELGPNERREVLRLSLDGVARERLAVVVKAEGQSTTRLLCEPKELDMPMSELTVRPEADALVVHCPGPVLELYLYDDEGGAKLQDNFVSLLGGDSVRLRCVGTPKALRARSLAGEHVVHVR